MKTLYFSSYASFGQRFSARLIDIVIVGFLGYIVAVLFQPLILVPNPGSDVESLSKGFAILIFCIIYQPIFESTGGTIGKRLLKIKPVNIRTGESPSLLNSYGRSLIYLFLTLLFFIPSILSCLVVLKSPKKQTWHDSTSNIIVINTV